MRPCALRMESGVEPPHSERLAHLTGHLGARRGSGPAQALRNLSLAQARLLPRFAQQAQQKRVPG